jgi:hypothetical protein
MISVVSGGQDTEHITTLDIPVSYDRNGFRCTGYRTSHHPRYMISMVPGGQDTEHLTTLDTVYDLNGSMWTGYRTSHHPRYII